MKKTILITGSTDGIGLETAKRLASDGHHVLLHGRSEQKLERAKSEIGGGEGYIADLSSKTAVSELAMAVSEKHPALDALINNAGVFHLGRPKTSRGLDVRFVVNTLAPYLLTKLLLGKIASDGRIVNLSSAAQAPVSLPALRGQAALSDNAAYAQSKLALTMWSRLMGESMGTDGPAIIAVNPGSFLGSKMVKEAYGIAGGDLGKGADILKRAALEPEFASAGGKYFDNDSGRFAPPHSDALIKEKVDDVVQVVEELCALSEW